MMILLLPLAAVPVVQEYIITRQAIQPYIKTVPAAKYYLTP